MPTKRQIVEAAVALNYEMMRSWCNDEWHYVGVVVTLMDPDMFEVDSRSLWGIPDNDADYLKEVRDELCEELLPLTRFEREMRRAVS